MHPTMMEREREAWLDCLMDYHDAIKKQLSWLSMSMLYFTKKGEKRGGWVA